MACGETMGIQRGEKVVDSKLRPSVRCVCVLWMVEYSVLVCNSLGVLKAGRVTSVWWRTVRDDRTVAKKRRPGGPSRRDHTDDNDTYRYARKSPTNPLRDSDEPSRLKTFEKNTAVQTN